MSGEGEQKGGLLAMAEQAEVNLNAAAGGGSLPGLSPAGQEAAPEIDQAEKTLSDAETLVDAFCGVVRLFWPVLNYAPEMKAEAVGVLAPLLKKYDMAGSFLSEYREEFKAGAFVVGIGWMSYKIVQADKTSKAEQEAAGGEGGN